ncbi:MAG: formyl transferase [Bacteroidetes bacterium]|nr:formyl transferase [Bacteroidota bacterium]
MVYTEGKNAINNIEYVKEIRNLKPDLITVCGCSILRDGILSIPPQGVINLHSGLSQVYRGTWTTLWAIYNKEPEYVGATVHYVSAGIDDGDIFYQGRPEIQEGDNPETLYTKELL